MIRLEHYFCPMANAYMTMRRWVEVRTDSGSSISWVGNSSRENSGCNMNRSCRWITEDTICGLKHQKTSTRTIFTSQAPRCFRNVMLLPVSILYVTILEVEKLFEQTEGSHRKRAWTESGCQLWLIIHDYRTTVCYSHVSKSDYPQTHLSYPMARKTIPRDTSQPSCFNCTVKHHIS